jgi:predicted branched-subunit amino acid permease
LVSIKAFTENGPSTTEVWMGSALGGDSEGYFAGVRVGVPFALVVGVVAFSFGVLARSLGWGVIAPIVFSVATFSVTAQFAVAMVLGAGGGR